MPTRAMLMNRFTRQSRLLHPEQFRAVFNGHPDTVNDRLFRLLAISRRQPQSASMDAPEQIVDSRLGLAIAKKNVPKASQRNRIKRQIREAFRHFHCLQQAKLCNCDGDITDSQAAADTQAALDIVVLARPAAAKADKTELRASIEQLLYKLGEQSRNPT